MFWIQNQCLSSVILKLPNNAFEIAEFWCIVGLTAILRLLAEVWCILRLLQRELHFSLICRFYYCLV